MNFPCIWGGKTISSMYQLCQYSGYGSREIEKKISEGKNLEEIFLGSKIGKNGYYYPQVYNKRVLLKDEDIVTLFGVPKESVRTYRIKGMSVEYYMSMRDKRYKSSSKYIIEEFAKSVGCSSYKEFQEKYNKNKNTDRVIVSWILKNKGSKYVLRKLSVIKYPYTYYGVVYNSDEDVAKKFNLLPITVHNRRIKGYSFKEIIKEVSQYADGYPFTTDTGITVTTDKQMAELCNQSIDWVRNRRRSGYSPMDMYLGSVGEPVKRDTRVVNNGVFVNGVLWYNSILDCVSRLGLHEFYSSILKVDDIDEGLGRAFVKFAEKYNKGYVTPILKVDHFTHEYCGSMYYCCYLDGEVEYLNSKEILDLRLRYIQYSPESKIYRNNGVFNKIIQAALFYNTHDSSIKRRMERENVSIEEAIKGLAFNKTGQKFIEVDGMKYNGYKACSDKFKMNNTTLRSRMVDGSLPKDKVIVTHVKGSLQSVVVDKYVNGMAVGKETVTYRSLKDLELKLGLRACSIASIRHDKNLSLEDACNELLKRYREYWIPFTNRIFYSMNTLCNETGLNYNRVQYAYRIGKMEGLTFYESVKKYYFATRKSFSINKETFTIKHSNGSISSLLDIVDMGNEKLYHYLTMPEKSVKVLSFDELFAILIRNRLGR